MVEKMAMVNKILIIQILLQGAFFSMAKAEALSAYRQNYKSGLTAVELEQAAMSRVFSLRGKLGTSTVDLESLKKVLKSNAKQVKNLENYVRSSDIVMQSMFELIERFVQNKEYAKPMSFSPSDYSYEIQDKILDQEQALCSLWSNEIHEKSKSQKIKIVQNIYLKKLQDEVAYYETRKLQKNAGSAVSGSAGASAQAEKQILEAIEQYLSQYKQLSKQLGNLVSVDFIDGRLDKIYFSKDKQTYPISLAMLATFSSGYQSAYMASLRCLTRSLESIESIQQALEVRNKYLEQEAKAKNNMFKSLFLKLSKKDKEKADQDLQLYDLAVKKLKDAQKIQIYLAKLENTQVAILIDMLLQSRFEDIPTVYDFSNSAQTTIPYLAQSVSESKSAKATMDYQYYSRMHTDLNNLEEYLDFQMQSKSYIKEIIQDLKQDKKEETK